jgi:hypothetical protein
LKEKVKVYPDKEFRRYAEEASSILGVDFEEVFEIIRKSKADFYMGFSAKYGIDVNVFAKVSERDARIMVEFNSPEVSRRFYFKIQK